MATKNEKKIQSALFFGGGWAYLGRFAQKKKSKAKSSLDFFKNSDGKIRENPCRNSWKSVPESCKNWQLGSWGLGMFFLRAFLEKALATLLLTKTMASIGSAQAARLSRLVSRMGRSSKKDCSRDAQKQRIRGGGFFWGWVCLLLVYLCLLTNAFVPSWPFLEDDPSGVIL